MTAYIVLGIFSYILLFTVALIEREKGSWDYIFFTLHGRFPKWMPWMFWSLLALSFLSRPYFGLILSLYLVVAMAHELFFTRHVIWDVVMLSTGFSMRAIAGVWVLYDVSLSPWLVACTFLLSMVVALGKRKNDVARDLAREEGNNHVEKGYTVKLLDQMMGVVSSSTFVAYVLYTISERTTHQVAGSTHLLYTTPFVLYGILRYLYLVDRADFKDGTELAVLKDRPMIINIALWLISIVLILTLR